MLDLHDLAGKGHTRCFRALGASLLDIPKRRGSGEVFAASSSRGGEPCTLCWLIAPVKETPFVYVGLV